LATTYGEQPVLATLPLCMREKALNWFSGLNEDVTTLMAESLEEWKIQLIRRFNANASQALSKADAMKHSFADESVLDIREYITEKQSLYVAAGEKDEDLIVRRIHDGLDPTLASTISLRDSHNTMNDFCSKVYSVEHKARAQYQQLQDQLQAQFKMKDKFSTKQSYQGYSSGWVPRYSQPFQQRTSRLRTMR
jgi:hypothetical protein